jgi:coenzyme F420-reducing hydrogenase beta subunit
MPRSADRARGGRDELPAALLSPAEIVRSGFCIGCGSCVAHLPPAGTDGVPRMAFDAHGLLAPAASEAWLRRRSQEFAETCPFSPAAADEDELAAFLFPAAAARHGATGRFISAHVGHVRESSFRADGSSGGLVTWVLAELFRRGLIDGAAHVAPVAERAPGEPFFRYRLARCADDLRAGAKSRYYPVEMSPILEQIRSTPGVYAVVGVPCFIKAVQLLRRRDPVLGERIAFTLGLFCGHMKSARFVESFAWQMGVSVDDVAAVEFRRKDSSRPASTYTAELRLRDGSTRVRDWWNMVDGDWGAGFFQSPACNYCDDVVGETADISFGDAWVEPYASDGRGTNVVVTRSEIVDRLLSAGIADGRLELQRVDGDFVERTQAAGLRQRREGLGYRLTWHRRGLTPRKRVAPRSDQPLRRKLIYRSRAAISAGSHRLFRIARHTGNPGVYLRPAGVAQAGYHALTYSRGTLGRLVDRVLPRA